MTVVANRFEDEAEESEVRLQYLKRRKVLLVWPSERASEPIEVPRAALVEALGDEGPRADGPPPRYLLIAGVPTRFDGGGEPRPFVATFEHEEQARAAFQSLRLRAQPRTAWAQIVSIGSKGHPQTVCWFGTASPHRPGADRPERAIATEPDNQDTGAKPVVRRWRTWPRRRQASPGPSAPPAPSGRKATRKEHE